MRIEILMYVNRTVVNFVYEILFKIAPFIVIFFCKFLCHLISRFLLTREFVES